MTAYVKCYKQDGFGRFPKGTKYPIIRETKTTWRVFFGNWEGTVFKESGRIMHHHGTDSAEFCLYEPEPIKATVTEIQLDLIPKKRPVGRPKTGTALTPAQKQAAYRARKAQKSVTVTFNRDAVEALDMHIRALASGHDVSIDPDKLKSILESIRLATQSQLVSGA